MYDKPFFGLGTALLLSGCAQILGYEEAELVDAGSSELRSTGGATLSTHAGGAQAAGGNTSDATNTSKSGGTNATSGGASGVATNSNTSSTGGTLGPSSGLGGTLAASGGTSNVSSVPTGGSTASPAMSLSSACDALCTMSVPLGCAGDPSTQSSCVSMCNDTSSLSSCRYHVYFCDTVAPLTACVSQYTNRQICLANTSAGDWSCKYTFVQTGPGAFSNKLLASYGGPDCAPEIAAFSSCSAAGTGGTTSTNATGGSSGGGGTSKGGANAGGGAAATGGAITGGGTGSVISTDSTIPAGGTGGATAIGSTIVTGGSIATGGSGGAVAAGGNNPTGGAISTGGALATGGAATGGTVTTGGAVTGGTTTSTGGASGGGAAAGGSNSGGCTSAGPTVQCATATATGSPAVIDEFGTSDGWLATNDQRKGGWFTWNDGTGLQTPAPPSCSQPMPNSGARCMSGSGFNTYGAGIGVTLNAGKDCVSGHYDASAYVGVSFTISGTVSGGSLRFQIPTGATEQPAYGGYCSSKCSDYFGKSLSVSATPQVVNIPFSDLTQAGWGTSAVWSSSEMLALQWQVTPTFYGETLLSTADFSDVCISSLAFLTTL